MKKEELNTIQNSCGTVIYVGYNKKSPAICMARLS
jgi:hypothetical protein